MNVISFFGKDERMDYIAMVDNGKLVDTKGRCVCAPKVFTGYEAWMYAMDRYGNLFCKLWGNNKEGYGFNHSSFNAGREVISAGNILIKEGFLLFIDNLSGHYKPSKDNLQQCAKMLHEQGVDISQAIVVFTDGVDEFFYSLSTFHKNYNNHFKTGKIGMARRQVMIDVWNGKKFF